MLSLSTIDRMVHHVGIVNTLVDKLVSKFVPEIPVAAGCPGWYTYYEYVIIGYICAEKQVCNPTLNKCLKYWGYTFYYTEAPWTCTTINGSNCTTRTCKPSEGC